MDKSEIINWIIRGAFGGFSILFIRLIVAFIRIVKEREKIIDDIKNEKEEREKCIEKIDDIHKELFSNIKKMNDDIIKIEGKIEAREMICKNNHRWNGINDRRNEN